MSTLRSALEEFTSEDLVTLPDARLEEDFEDLQRAAEVLEAERLRRLGEIERRGCYQRDGHLCVASWLAHRFRMAFSGATRLVRTARALRDMPGTTAALAAGEVSPSAVDLLAQAHQAEPEAFAPSEAVLVEAARSLSIRDLGRALAHWRQVADARRAAALEEDRSAGRRLHVSATVFGMVRVDGDLDPDTGQTLITALRSITDAEVRDPEDHRSPAQRRADALGEICARWLAQGDRPTVAGDRPHVVVTADVAALQGDPEGRGELEDAGPILPSSVRRWACDPSLIRVIMRGASEPLDVGRRTPVVPPAMRRGLVVRDRGCRFPGCDRPPAWCDAHHVAHWADGGATALSNLVLLCRRHHRLVHHGYRLELHQGRPVFRRPDGSVLEDRAPP